MESRDKRKFASTKRSRKKFRGRRPGDDDKSEKNIPPPPVEIEQTQTAEETEVSIVD